MRLEIIDTMRGLSFVLMFIYHIYVFINLFSKNYYIKENILIQLVGILARYIFIILFGVSLYLSYNKYKKKNKKKQLKKTLTLFISSLYISLFSYKIIPEKFIYFGILHFMTLVNFIMIYIINKKNILLLLLILIQYYKHNDLIYNYSKNYTNNIFKSILGLGYYKNSIDYFSLLKWLDIVIIGIFIGYLIVNYKNEERKKEIKKDNKIVSILNKIGSNSLILYLIHFPILYIIIKIVNI